MGKKFDCSQTSSLERVLVGAAKGNGTKCGQDTEKNRDGLLEAKGAGDGGTAQHDRGKETQLNAVGLAVLDAVATEAICFGGRISTQGKAGRLRCFAI